MSRNTFRRFWIALPSLLGMVFLLLATLGVPVSQHFCCGTLQDTQLYSQAKDCGMPEEANTTGAAVSTAPCCHSELSLQMASGLENDGRIKDTRTFTVVDLASTPAYLGGTEILLVSQIEKAPYPAGPPSGSASHSLQKLLGIYLI